MDKDPPFRANLRHWISAIIAAATVTFLALYPSARADAERHSCTLRDAAAWMSELEQPSQEATPTYVREITERFLSHCPERPEVKQAHKVAGLAALDQGDVKAAVAHLQAAGWSRDTYADFAFAAALLADGQVQKAWRIRDDLVQAWQTKTENDRSLDLSSHTFPGGTIHRISQDRPGEGLTISWTAIPDGPGWPATLELMPDRMYAALRDLPAIDSANAPYVLSYYRCSDFKRLRQFRGLSDMNAVNLLALKTLSHYLSQPESDVFLSIESAVQSCLWQNRLLPSY